jgi:acetyltransferase-like isoleucine patch superfamily enzyme
MQTTGFEGNMQYPMCRIYDNVKLGKNVTIEDFVIIGLPPKGSKPGELETIIGDNSIIRAGTIIYAGNHVGNNFQTGHHVVIRENNMIGNDCAVGTQGEVAFNTKIGNNVRFHSDCHIYEDTIIEDDVRFNPGVYVLNTKYPYRPGEKPIIEPVYIKQGAIIAARSTLMPGIIIGRYALVGAESLVTKDVPDYAIVYGHPAVIKGDIRDMKDKNGVPLYQVK